MEVELTFTTLAAAAVRVELSLLDVDRCVDMSYAVFRLPPGRSTRTLSVNLPDAARHGYGLRAIVESEAGRSVAQGAIEALDGWWQSPRHAALTSYRTAKATAAAVRRLRDWHVTVVQLYDWMYRHYRYEPPSGDIFVDALGQTVSHAAVRAAVTTGHEVGIASLAYGSVYGAEREYVDAHPDERVFDADGVPLSLGEVFYINDLRPESPWRRRLLDEYQRTIRYFGVDGIHMDTYGPPHHGFGSDGTAISFAALYPALIADGAAAVAAVDPTARVLFNCVEGFPLEAVATAPAAAIYLELWPPDIDYADIVRWIEQARHLGQGRAVVIAAYISTLRTVEHDAARRVGAIEAAVLLTSVIAASGAYHHVLAERDRLLVEGYYPEARALQRRERSEISAAWAFTARYLHLLSDPGSTESAASGFEIRDGGGRLVPTSATPTSGSVWVRATVTPDFTRVVQLIDLLDQVDERWDAERQPMNTRRGWRLVWPDEERPPRQVAMTPWSGRGAARRMVAGALPPFRRWIVVAAPRA